MKLKQLIAPLLSLLFVPSLSKAQNCSEGAATSVKHHKIYLYFPTSDDATFPDFATSQGYLQSTSPLKKFDVADLDASIGSTNSLISSVLSVVQEDYCEFDVEVVSTQTKPTPSEAQWNIVGIGSDANDADGLFGLAQNADINNSIAQDYARVWAGTYKSTYGPGGSNPPLVLSGAGSTLDRWANAIGGTASHEAGHNFGLVHSTVLRPGEDALQNHLMPAGPSVDGTHRVANRHFSDESYEILAHNIGLNTFTVTNWDFINPNAQEAHSCVITVLSHASSLSFSRVYTGSRSPWKDPTITAAGTATYQGDTYNKFTITFSVPQAWEGGVDGIVPGGAPFHVGVSFNEPDPFIVYETRLRDASGTNLGLHPRVPSFDEGSADKATGDFVMKMNNASGAPLEIANLEVFYLPRQAAIENMITGDTLKDNQGYPIHMQGASKSFTFERNTILKDSASFRLARYTDPRMVDLTYDSTNCKRGLIVNGKHRGVGDGAVNDVEYCPNGIALSLFPSTYVYIKATVVDKNATYYDRAQHKMVTGPLTSTVFYQFAGKVPDFNHNGIDDLIDIRTKTSVDKNNNGIPDESEGNTQPQHTGSWILSYWWILLLILIFLAVIFIIRKK
jgi:hypothetical protein